LNPFIITSHRVDHNYSIGLLNDKRPYLCHNTLMIPVILIDRPRLRNTIDDKTVNELTDLCQQFGADPEVVCVIVTGAGRRYFCAGARYNRRLYSSDTFVSPEQAISQLEMPVIAAINGDALDLGLEIALACDIRIASATAHFGFPQITAGVLPSAGGTQRLPRLIGRGRALEVLLTGDVFDATSALEMGLVDEVVPANSVMKRTEELAAAIGHKAPRALKYTKEAVNDGLDMPLDQGLRLEEDLYLLLQTTADRTEGVRAFLKKRNPAFKGR
jgi:enoyl-CoA hydratase